MKRFISAESIFTVVIVIIVIVLSIIPTGFPSNAHPDSIRSAVRVVDVNNENVIHSAVGFIFQG